MEKQKKNTFVANRKTKKYHYSPCPYVKGMLDDNKILLGDSMSDKNTLFVLENFVGCKFCEADKHQTSLDSHTEL